MQSRRDHFDPTTDRISDETRVTPLAGPKKRRRYWRWAASLAILVAASALYFHAFCNWSMHSEQWLSERMDDAVVRGLDYLYKAGTFGQLVNEGGESPPHHFFLELVLKRRDHPGLREQMARAKNINRDNWEWRCFYGMPGWPRRDLTVADHRHIKYAVGHSEGNYYGEWLLHGLYPERTKLRPVEETRLFKDTSLLKHSYQWTHALVAYLWLKQTHPTVAADREVDRLITEVTTRLYRTQSWDPRTSDIFNERVAFLLYADDGPPIQRRWIERIILSQNTDGGWTFRKSIDRTIGQLFGIDFGRGDSHTHATFLALYALTHYETR